MTETVSLLDPLWSDIQVLAYGGAYGVLLGDELRHRALKEMLESAIITDSSHEPCRRCVFTFDNFHASALSPVHIGTHWAIWGRTMTPEGIPTDNREIFLGATFHDSRKVQGGNSQRVYTVYEWAGNALGRNEGQMVFDGGGAWGPEGPTMTQVVEAICAETGMTLSRQVDTGFPIGQLIQSPGMSYWDVIEEAASRTVERTGRRFLVRAAPNAKDLELVEMGQTGVVWKINDGESGILSSVQLDESAEDLATFVTAVVDGAADNNLGTRTTATATASYGQSPEVPEFRTWLGEIRRVITPSEDMGTVNPEATSTTPQRGDNKAAWVAYAMTQGLDQESAEAQTKQQLVDAYLPLGADQAVDVRKLQQYVDRQLANVARTKISLHTESLQIPGIRRGDAVMVYSLRWGIVNVPFYVETVVTTYESGQMLQSIDLVLDPRDG